MQIDIIFHVFEDQTFKKCLIAQKTSFIQVHTGPEWNRLVNVVNIIDLFLLREHGAAEEGANPKVC